MRDHFKYIHVQQTNDVSSQQVTPSQSVSHSGFTAQGLNSVISYLGPFLQLQPGNYPVSPYTLLECSDTVTTQ